MIGELVGYQALFCCCSVMCNCEVIANGHGRQLNFGKLYKCSNDHLIFSSSVQRTPHTKKLSLVPATETTVPPYSKVRESGVFLILVIIPIMPKLFMQLSFIGWQVCYPGTRSRDIINNRQCGSLDKKV